MPFFDEINLGGLGTFINTLSVNQKQKGILMGGYGFSIIDRGRGAFITKWIPKWTGNSAPSGC